MKKTLRELMRMASTDPRYLIQTDLTYPTITGNESNFIDDYETGYATYNEYIILKRGSQYIDIDENFEDPWTYFTMILKSITSVYQDSWARLYYALSLSYNPIYNVDGTTSRTTGERVKTDSFGEAENDTEYGATSETLGTHTDTGTDYSVSTDSQAEKETGKTTNVIGQQTNTSLTHTDKVTLGTHEDTHTEDEWTETETRKGNIGVTMTQQMMNAEWEFRKKSFFEYVLNRILDEAGFYYSGGIET